MVYRLLSESIPELIRLTDTPNRLAIDSRAGGSVRVVGFEIRLVNISFAGVFLSAVMTAECQAERGDLFPGRRRCAGKLSHR